VALWASFLSGNRIDDKVPIDKEAQWLFQLTPEQTFLPLFDLYKTIDVPAFSFKQHNHARERQFMREAFADEVSFDDFDAVVWRHHDENKKELFQSLDNYDLVMGYFDLVDAIGHLSYGVSRKMKEAYSELDVIAKEVRSSTDDVVLIASDHGMRPFGRYGEHYGYGFYSTNYRSHLRLPRITDFRDEITRITTYRI
jgi:predicted AlkP superfamily pyrophosphatase or phosphodiesterase